jgi:hypothetical protein
MVSSNEQKCKIKNDNPLVIRKFTSMMFDDQC